MFDFLTALGEAESAANAWREASEKGDADAIMHSEDMAYAIEVLVEEWGQR